MDRALWLLLGLRFRAWVRRLARNAATPRGTLFLLAGLAFFALILGPNILTGLRRHDDPPVEKARRYGPLVLFGYCVLTVLFSSGEQSVSFSPGEVQFLFPGPFSRRQLLAYKVTGNSLLCLLYALLLTAFFLPYAAEPPHDSPDLGPILWAGLHAYLGLVLTLWFIQLFGLALSLALHTVGAQASTRPRRLLLAAAAGLALWALLYAGRGALGGGGPASLLVRLEEAPAVRAALAPLRWFVETFTAERLWPDFALGAARCLALNAALLLLVFLLDAQYLETAAAASERAYARLQRLRSSGAVAAASSTGTARVSLPSLPWWGGAGPLAWRQLTTALRSRRPLLIFLGVFTLVVVGPRLAASDAVEDRPFVGWLLATTLLGMTLAVLTPLLTFDFRGDLDRMDVLKALPVAPAWLALGQLFAPVLLLSLVQVAVVALAQLLWGGVGALLIGVALYALPFNFLSLGVENLLFLWFPVRLQPAAPGDFQMMGRQTLMMAIKFAALGLALGPAVGVGVAIYGIAYAFGVDATGPAVAAAWLILAGFALGTLPLLARAFRAFDVARDTPP
jgi:hypothetical protein